MFSPRPDFDSPMGMIFNATCRNDSSVEGGSFAKPSDDRFFALDAAGFRNNHGLLIINADDWGRDRNTSERILDCIRCGTVSSVSAMVFMEDSERAAVTARAHGVDVGLHLNFTTPFSAASTAKRLREHQQRLSHYLRRHRFAQVIFHPGLDRSFEYVVAAQLEEFRRLYGALPDSIDGHHHMHLCANVLLRNLLPFGTVVRRNFSFQAGEKGFCNRLYRRAVDGILRHRHRLTDFFFVLPPLEPADRMERIFSLARQFVVEVETHPVNPEEYRLLTGPEIISRTRDLLIGPRAAVAQRDYLAG